MIDRDMSKTDLRLKAGISTMALAKLGKNENVSMDVLKKVCKALECNIGDIMDLVPEDEKKSKKNCKLQEQGRKMSTCRLYIE